MLLPVVLLGSALVAPCLAFTAPVALLKARSFSVDAAGNRVAPGSAGEIKLRSGEVKLPNGDGGDFSTELQGVAIDRKATALVVEPESPADAKAAVVFLHGFSQQPKNYMTTLSCLAASGIKVVAPQTWVLDVILPWVTVETSTNPFDLPGKLQTAVIIDGLRCLQLLQDEGFASISLAGHSMGGACALVIPRILDATTEIKAICVESPAAVASSDTTLNPFLTGDGNPFKPKLAFGNAVKLFKQYDTVPQVLLLSAANDLIVPAGEVESIYKATQDPTSKIASTSALGAILSGSHIGFEDSFVVDLQFRKFTIPLFTFLDFLVYSRDLGEAFLGDLDAQLITAKKLAVRHFAAFAGSKDTSNDISYIEARSAWSEVLKLTTDSDEIKDALTGSPP